MRRQSTFVAAGGLHDDQGDRERLQGRGQHRMAIDVIGKLSGAKVGTQHRTVDVCLSNVDAYHH